jgi:hypothetical protein
MPEEGRELRHRHRVPGYCGGRSPTMASSTAGPRPIGIVYGVADVEGRLQVQGEVAGWVESTGHDGVRACPWPGLCALA